MSSTAASPRPARATAFQRLRAGVIRLLAAFLRHLPQGAADALAEAVGEAYYRLSPSRAAQARRNLGHVAAYCAEKGIGSARARAAAADPAALERLVRASYRDLAIVYFQMLRGPAPVQRAVDAAVIETPEVLADAVARSGPTLFVGMHFGSIDMPAIFLARQSGRPTQGPAETLADPALQALIDELRRPMGIRMVPLDRARHELRAALRRGEAVGIVADRDIGGGGIATPLFGMPAPLPVGPALLALDTGVPVLVAAVRRLPDGRWAGRIERLIAMAPEQWWAVFHPIWPDLEGAGPAPRTGERR